MKTHVSATISRYCLAALFLFAAGAKLYMRHEVTESFFSNVPRLIGRTFGLPVAVTIVAAEFIVAALLLGKRTSRLGAMGAAGMLTAFAGYALYYRFGLGNEEGLECGCFGGIVSSQLGVTTAVRNLIFLIPALLVLGISPREWTGKVSARFRSIFRRALPVAGTAAIAAILAMEPAHAASDSAKWSGDASASAASRLSAPPRGPRANTGHSLRRMPDGSVLTFDAATGETFLTDAAKMPVRSSRQRG